MQSLIAMRSAGSPTNRLAACPASGPFMRDRICRTHSLLIAIIYVGDSLDGRRQVIEVQLQGRNDPSRRTQ